MESKANNPEQPSTIVEIYRGDLAYRVGEGGMARYRYWLKLEAEAAETEVEDQAS